MSAFSFIHAADLHLGSPFSNLSLENPDLAAIMRSATYEAFDNVIRLCIDRKVDFLLIAGDVYDGEDRNLKAQVRFRDGLKRLSDAGISSYVVHGNHDPLNVWASSIAWPPGVHLFKEMIETVAVKRDNDILAHVQGISDPKREKKRNLSRLLKRTGPGFHIGLLHANLGTDTGHEPYAPCSMEDLKRQEMDYWGLGHVHNHRVVSREIPFILYPGNTQGRNIRETGERGCYLIEVEDDRVVKEDFHSTSTVTWDVREIRIDDLSSEQDLLDTLNRTCLLISEHESGRGSIVRFILTGSGPISGSLRHPNILEDLLEITRESGISLSPFVYVDQIRDKTVPELDFDELSERQDFLGELYRYSMELIAGEDTGTLLEKELSALFDDPKARRFLDFPKQSSLIELIEEASSRSLQALYGED